MPDTTPILALPVLLPGQAQPYVTHNTALRRLDMLAQTVVETFDAETPPELPEAGRVYALGPVPTAAWAGHPLTLATWIDETWLFIDLQPGWRAWSRDGAGLRIWTGTAWARPQADLDRIAGLGIRADHDATNRLAVKAEATLLSHDGGGHQLKINKATTGDTASLLFQSNWSGRAEMGLNGSNDWSIKVSPDGTGWTDALRINANGRVGIGASTAYAQLHVQHADAAVDALTATVTSTSFVRNVYYAQVARAASANYNFFAAQSEFGATSDIEFKLRDDGNAYADGSWNGGGADYAEYFEWQDGNPADDDRRGLSVVLEGDRIRPAAMGDLPVGVISGNPSVVGDADIGRWKGKYLRDDFGGYLWDIDGSAGPGSPPGATRRLNPAYDPTRDYVSRAERPEWDVVGLMGKLRLRRGQPVDPRWIKLCDISATVEEWLLR